MWLKVESYRSTCCSSITLLLPWTTALGIGREIALWVASVTVRVCWLETVVPCVRVAEIDPFSPEMVVKHPVMDGPP